MGEGADLSGQQRDGGTAGRTVGGIGGKTGRETKRERSTNGARARQRRWLKQTEQREARDDTEEAAAWDPVEAVVCGRAPPRR